MTRLSLLVDLASLLAREVDLDALLATAGERLAHALSADRATVWLVDAESGDLVTRVAVLPEVQVDPAGQTVCVDESAQTNPAAHGCAAELFAGQCMPMPHAVGAVDPAGQA